MKMIESVIEKCRMLRYNNCKEVQIRCRLAGGTSSSPFFYARSFQYGRVLFLLLYAHEKRPPESSDGHCLLFRLPELECCHTDLQLELPHEMGFSAVAALKCNLLYPHIGKFQKLLCFC